MSICRMFLIAVLGSVGLGTTSNAHAQSPTRQAIGLEDLMTAAEFRASGLQKLSEAEIAALNDWLQRFSIALLGSTPGTSVLRNAAPPITPPASTSATTPALIESRIDGQFEGWTGETIFKLQNGQIWQQSTYAYKYAYKFSPPVLIYRSGGGYRMQVEGVDGTIGVVPIR